MESAPTIESAMMHRRSFCRPWRSWALCLICAACLPAGAAQAGPTPDFNHDVLPILAGRCFKCHGPDEAQRKAELRLDDQASAHAKVIVPGSAANSPLIARVTSQDAQQVMPPADSNVPALTAAEVDVLRNWIDAQAKYELHWAYVPPRRAPLPEIPDPSWALNPIDHFVRAAHVEHGMEYAPRAERAVLIRRLSFDLVGLPPSPADVDQFLADDSQASYESLVDRLLASPHFGERMAMMWLDMVRFGDTNGYHADLNRNIFPYRDYVIEAFNRNLPFNQFTVEQLAGDLLPNPSTQQLVASGYNRQNMTTTEGGAQAAEYLAKYAADRVRNVSAVWLGATMGCAECHDHKYDPYRTRDFYKLAAFFSDLKQVGVYPNQIVAEPEIKVLAPETEAALAELRGLQSQVQAEIAVEVARIDASRETAGANPEAPANGPTDVVWFDDVPPASAQLQVNDGNHPWSWTSDSEGPVYSGALAMRRKADGLAQHFFTMAKEQLRIAAGDKLFAYVYLDPNDLPATIMLQFNDGTWEHRAFWGEDKISYGQPSTVAHVAMGPLPKAGEWVRLEVDAQQVGLQPGSLVSGLAFTQFGGLAYYDLAGIATTAVQDLVMPRWFATQLAWEDYERAHPDLTHAPEAIRAALAVGAGERSAEQQQLLHDHYVLNFHRPAQETLAPLTRRLAGLKAKEQALVDQATTTTEVSMSGPALMTRILPRGNWLDESGEVVEPGVPSFLPPLPADAKPTRLALASWITSGENPLTARVMVNRLWKLFHGAGLVTTMDDLGTQGARPSHAQLLDWLALEFQESGWDIKHMVRLLVTSRTYQQSSVVSHAVRQLDPTNRWLARQASFRLDAEIVRDNALAISGLLSPKIGGRSVKPYQPDGYWDHCNTFLGKLVYEQDHGEDLYRRGLYTFWKRTFLHPSLVAFDAPSREECTVERARSSTPLQALVLLNDPTYVEAARVFAQRLLKEGGENLETRLQFAYRLALSRPARPDELRVLADLYQKHVAGYATDQDNAQKLITVGEAARPESVDAVELAALTSVARVILNLHETITRN